jgi:hypothetical protein
MPQIISMLKNKHNFHKKPKRILMRNDFVQSGRGLHPSRLQNEGFERQICKINRVNVQEDLNCHRHPEI